MPLLLPGAPVARMGCFGFLRPATGAEKAGFACPRPAAASVAPVGGLARLWSDALPKTTPIGVPPPPLRSRGGLGDVLLEGVPRFVVLIFATVPAGAAFSQTGLPFFSGDDAALPALDCMTSRTFRSSRCISSTSRARRSDFFLRFRKHLVLETQLKGNTRMVPRVRQNMTYCDY